MHPRFYFCTNYEKCIQVLTTKNIKNIPIGTIAAMKTGVVMETTITTASTENIMIVQSRKLSGSLLSIISMSLENLGKGKQYALKTGIMESNGNSSLCWCLVSMVMKNNVFCPTVTVL